MISCIPLHLAILYVDVSPSIRMTYLDVYLDTGLDVYIYI